MALLAAERIKLMSTRSPWWCMLLTVVVAATIAAMIAASVPAGAKPTIVQSQAGSGFAQLVVLVMAGLAVTTEYRFGTIRLTFQAAPRRTRALLAKTAVVAVIGGVLGEISAFTSVFAARLVGPTDALILDTAQHWRNVAGVGLVYSVSAVLAVAIGILVRQTAGTVAILLALPLIGERFLGAIPGLGEQIYSWLPFNVALQFTTGGQVDAQAGDVGVYLSTSTLSPWGALAYYAGLAVTLLVIALVVANRRDA